MRTVAAVLLCGILAGCGASAAEEARTKAAVDAAVEAERQQWVAQLKQTNWLRRVHLKMLERMERDEATNAGVRVEYYRTFCRGLLQTLRADREAHPELYVEP